MAEKSLEPLTETDLLEAEAKLFLHGSNIEVALRVGIAILRRLNDIHALLKEKQT